MAAGSRSTIALNHVLARAFAPLHKRALGTAVGLMSGLVVSIVTIVQVVMQPADGLPLHLLSQYFYGYDVSWRGVAVGFWWAGVVGFVAGWFVAFLRNLAVATWIFFVRTKAELAQTQDFLDHI
jgi:hypothetical protein